MRCLKLAMTLLAHLALTIPAVDDAESAERVPIKQNRAAVLRSWTPEAIAAAVPLDRTVAIPQRAATAPRGFTSSREPVEVITTGQPPRRALAGSLATRLAPPRIVPTEDVPGKVDRRAASVTTGALYTQTRVSPPELAVTFPYLPTGKIFARNAQGQGYICSGSVIAPRIVVTAAHCIFDNTTGTFSSAFIFVPAYFLGTAPAGVWTPIAAFIPGSWVQILDIVHPEDFAVLVMGDIASGGQVFRLGDVVGFYGAALSDVNTHLFHIDFLGYPANLDGGEVMQRTGAQTQFTFAPNNAIYGSDQQGGSSGGPYLVDLQITADGGPFRYPVVVAVESFGNGEGLVGVSLFNGTFLQLLQAGCNFTPGSC